MPKLSNASIAFCDSKKALLKAYDNGLKRNTIVKTISPSLLIDKKLGFYNLENNLSNSAWENFFYSADKYVNEIFLAAVNNKILKPYAVTLARVAYANEKLTLKAALLKREDFNETVAVINYYTKNKSLNARTVNPWNILLSRNTKLVVKNYEVEDSENRSSSGGNKANFFLRLGSSSINSICYRLLEISHRFIPSFFFKGTFGIISENEKLKDIALKMILEGYKVKKIKKPKPKNINMNLNNKFSKIIRSEIIPIIKKRAKIIVNDLILNDLGEYSLKLMVKAINEFENYYDNWPSFIKDNTKAIFSGYPYGAIDLSLAKYSNDIKIPFVSFQHGLDREITFMQSKNHINLENSVAEFFVAYNYISKSASTNNLYRSKQKGKKSTILVNGLSSDHYRINRHSFKRNKNAILFVSTALYRGYSGHRNDPISDFRTANMDINIIKNVLSKVNHKVYFKPYPARRYPDKDPIIKVANKYENINLTGENIDLRYIINNYKVLITMRATSTLGWCLLSNKPLIFINVPYWFELKEEMKELFQKSIFYFNYSDKNCLSSLKDLLSLPLNEIEKLWKAKEKDRKKLSKILLLDKKYLKVDKISSKVFLNKIK